MQDPPRISPQLLRRPGTRRQEGFALVTVIWAIGLLALLFVTYIAAARYRGIESSRLAEHARSEGLASAAIQVAILDLLARRFDPSPSPPRIRLDGTPVYCTLGGGARVAISIADEGGKVDLNTADPALIAALARGLQPTGGAGATLAKEIIALREAASAAQRAQGIVSETASAFRTVFEVDQLSTVDSNLLQAMIPLVTVHSKSTGFDPQLAPLDVLQALSSNGLRLARAEARSRLPPSYVADSPGQAFLVTGAVATAGGARASVAAVVELSQDPAAGYHIRELREGSLHVTDRASARLSPC
jgi:general secretion pathway protein K